DAAIAHRSRFSNSVDPNVLHRQKSSDVDEGTKHRPRDRSECVGISGVRAWSASDNPKCWLPNHCDTVTFCHRSGTEWPNCCMQAASLRLFATLLQRCRDSRAQPVQPMGAHSTVRFYLLTF